MRGKIIDVSIVEWINIPTHGWEAHCVYTNQIKKNTEMNC